MTWGARAGAAGVLSLLAVAWAGGAHLWADPPAGHAAELATGGGIAGPAAAGGDAGLTAGGAIWPLLWTGLAVALLAWLALPLGRGSGARRGLVVGGVLLVGQLLGHAALSIAPLLAHQVRAVGPAAPHADAAHAAALNTDAAHAGASHAAHVGAWAAGPVQGPGLESLLAALAHGGSPMLLAHGLATIAAAAAWALAGRLWEALADWWGRVTLRHTAIRLLPAAPAPVSTLPVRSLCPVPSWHRRGPPLPV